MPRQKMGAEVDKFVAEHPIDACGYPLATGIEKHWAQESSTFTLADIAFLQELHITVGEL